MFLVKYADHVVHGGQLLLTTWPLDAGKKALLGSVSCLNIFVAESVLEGLGKADKVTAQDLT